MNRNQAAVAAGVIAVAAALALGAAQISGDAGYQGVGPNFLPWVVAVALLAGGVLLVREAVTGGFRRMEEPSGDATGYWPGFLWVSAGLLANAALITTIGFILANVVCFTLASQGFVAAGGNANRGLRGWATDAAIGFAIAAPVYWMFTQGLAISLPGLTNTGWI
jgi:putative tricarboxylic transport membrane protein